MRHKTFIRGGHRQGNLGPNGGNATGAVYLYSDPTIAMEAATKNYVDNAASAVSAAAFTSGTINKERIPAFSGDLIKNAGEDIISLPNRGVANGSYAKVRVTSKGLVASGAGLTEADIPALPFSKLISDLPTTAAGYGITDALSKTNPTMTGVLRVGGEFTDPKEIVNKAYVDGALVPRSSIGDIEFKVEGVNPANRLRANGASVGKDAYPELYARIGDTHTFFQVPGAGLPWRNQFHINNTQNSSTIGSWNQIFDLPAALSNHEVLVTDRRVYVMGGVTSTGNTTTVGYGGGTVHNTIYSSRIGENGQLEAWYPEGNLPEAVIDSCYFATKSRLYAIGGRTSANVNRNTVYSYAIDPYSGVLSLPVAETAFPEGISGAKAIITKNRVYLIGGFVGESVVAPSNKIFTSTIDTNGVITGWSEVSTPLPRTIARHSVFVTQNRAYMIAGYTPTVGTESLTSLGNYSGKVYTATIDGEGVMGTWAEVGTIPTLLADPSVYVTTNRVYVFGSIIDSTSSGAIFSAPINRDGTIGTWENTGLYPEAVGNGAIAAIGPFLYHFGGNKFVQASNGNVSVATVRRAPIDANIINYIPEITKTIDVNESNFNLPNVTIPRPGMVAYIVVS